MFIVVAQVAPTWAEVVQLYDALLAPRLAEYQPYWAARAELLAKTGAHGEARHAYEIAIGLERDASVRRFLQQRQAALAP
jgi:RNA polymerase sigma-70 factor (ECF subfamily)